MPGMSRKSADALMPRRNKSMRISPRSSVASAHHGGGETGDRPVIVERAAPLQRGVDEPVIVARNAPVERVGARAGAILARGRKEERDERARRPVEQAGRQSVMLGEREPLP